MVKISRLDEIILIPISKIPTSFHNVFIWLGRLTTPLLWASYIAIIHLLFLSPGILYGSGLLLICLLPLASLMKIFFRRKRPASVYVEGMRIKSYSFPSSHAYSAVLSLGYFSSVAFVNGLYLLSFLLIVLNVIIGISRIHIGAHYPSDVLAGWLIGLSVLISLRPIG